MGVGTVTGTRTDSAYDRVLDVLGSRVIRRHDGWVQAHCPGPAHPRGDRDPSLSVKDIIKEMIEKEGRPLTDAQIAERLRERGIEIARRTVAKYRMQLDILPSSLR